MRVGRDNGASASYFFAHIFGSDVTLDTQTLAVHIFTNGHILHLRSNDASLGASYLSDGLTSLGAVVNPLLTHSGQTFLQIHLIIRIGVRSAGVIDVNGSIGLHVRHAVLIACNGWCKVYFYHTHAHVGVNFALHVCFLALGICFVIVNHTLNVKH